MSAEVKDGAPQTPVTELLTGIVNDVGELVRQEMRFARKEIASDLRKTQAATTSLAIGVAVVFVGVLLLAHSLAWLLSWAVPSLPLWAAYGIVGLLIAAVGGSLAWAGYSKFKTFNPLPEKTIATIEENVSWQTNSTDAKTAS